MSPKESNNENRIKTLANKNKFRRKQTFDEMMDEFTKVSNQTNKDTYRRNKRRRER